VIKKVGIIHHPTRRKALDIVKSLHSEFEKAGVAIAYSIALEDWRSVNLQAFSSVDLVVSVGGDGTVIRVSHLILDANCRIPIWPIAAGEFNFMPDRVNPRDIHKAVSRLISGDYFLWNRPVMQVMNSTSNKKLFINDVVFVKDRPLDILDISVFIENEHIGSIKGDGLVIATSAGSTAYSLSAGGPIIDSNAPVYVLTALNPHHITIRPIVVSDEKTTNICIGDKPWHLLIDGLSDMLYTKKACFDISRMEDVVLSYLHVTGFYSWVDNIREKFHWGSRYVESDNS